MKLTRYVMIAALAALAAAAPVPAPAALPASPAAAAPARLTAPQVVAKAASAISSAKGISASFTLSTGKSSVKGTLKAAGRKFAIESRAMSAWYDGVALYSYNPHTAETTVTTPTAAELAETNPLLYVNSTPGAFSSSFASSMPKGKYVVNLVPKSRKNAIKKITVTLNASTFLPEKIVVAASGGAVSTCIVTSLDVRAKVPPSAFVYPRSRFPKTEIVDLR